MQDGDDGAKHTMTMAVVSGVCPWPTAMMMTMMIVLMRARRRSRQTNTARHPPPPASSSSNVLYYPNLVESSAGDPVPLMISPMA
jgi:hypothetical protein